MIIPILIGHININIIGDNANNRKYLDLLSENAYSSFINMYIILPIGHNHLCIDHIFIKSNDQLISSINAGVLQTDITDHCSML